jgi:CheY-like chemotaxis protein
MEFVILILVLLVINIGAFVLATGQLKFIKKRATLPNLSDMIVLAVEDDDASILLMTVILGPIVKRLIIAENGQKAVELVKLVDPDLILMDIKMPIMDGIYAAKVISKRNGDIPIIFLTAFDRFDTEDAAYLAGGWRFIQKPFTRKQLIDAMYDVFNTNGLPLPA